MTNQKTENTLFKTPFSRNYWKAAAGEFKKPQMLVTAAMLIALRVALKSLAIPVGENLYIYIGFFVNALGAMIFGPIVATVAAAVSYTLGALLFPTGAYFFPFIFVEMLGSFLFAVSLYRTKITSSRIILSRFLVSFFCNIVLNPIIMVYYYRIFYGKSYNLLNMARIIKNLALLPLESLLLIIFLRALIPVTNRMKLTYTGDEKISITKKSVIFLIVLTLIAVLSVVLYYVYRSGSFAAFFERFTK